jgi:hypothetical protein
MQGSPESRPAYARMRRAVDALITGSEPIRVRLRSAEESFRDVDPESDLATELERNLWHRIASNLVSGGAENDDELPGVVELARRNRCLKLGVENDEVDP